MKIHFATENEGKLAEAKRVLAPYGIQIVSYPIHLEEPTEGTVEGIALHKLEQAVRQGIEPVMVDDAGVYFAAYEEFPGVLSKRIFQMIGYRGIEKLLQNEEREAFFMGCVALSWQGEVKTFTGVMDGRICDDFSTILAPEPGFPYDPIFIPEGERNPIRELPIEKRLTYSYRRKALEGLMEWVKGQ